MQTTATSPIIDTHVHFWDRRHSGLIYSWLDQPEPHPILGDTDSLRVLRYSVDEYLAETRFQGVAKAIHVQAAFGTEDPVAETVWLQNLADKTGWPHGIVAFTDLAAKDAPRQIERHREAPLLRGFRDIRPAAILAQPAFRRGYAALAQHNLVFCHQVEWENIDLALDLVRAQPQVRFCLDQTGMPVHRDPAARANWQAALVQLAAEPNTVCKISSLGAGDPRWTVESLRPWILGAIDAFGTKRCFFGSNWPVDRLFSSYGDLVAAWADILAGFTPCERHQIMYANAAEWFAPA